MLSLNSDSVILSSMFLWNQPCCSFSQSHTHTLSSESQIPLGWDPLCLVERKKKKLLQKEAETTHLCSGLFPPSLTPPCGQEERPKCRLCLCRLPSECGEHLCPLQDAFQRCHPSASLGQDGPRLAPKATGLS